MTRTFLKQLLWGLLYTLSGLRLIPHLAVWKLSRNREIIDKDIARWQEILYSSSTHRGQPPLLAFIVLMTNYSEYRSLFYFRIGIINYLVRWLCRPLDSLYFACRDIGPGLFIQHGFSTIIAAQKIGKNCWINQQVTIGFEGSGSPIIGDYVRICAGAKVIGGVNVGDNAVIGANAVVVKAVEPHTVVGGVPAKLLRRLPPTG
jgi:serine O-acetyltransferase